MFHSTWMSHILVVVSKTWHNTFANTGYSNLCVEMDSAIDLLDVGQCASIFDDVK